ncbi:MAG TPA: CsbD family protein [Solirubrobacteraceae bacterium]|jgi:uncharacterized protein YjbJ (UPF0337 family)|nr:CsbD family protein [Solirubrobacteraceae bacterium]
MSDSYLDQAKGRVKAAAGMITGDEKLRRQGETDQAAAHVKHVASRVIDRAKDAFKKTT